jgi:hypothetical protein
MSTWVTFRDWFVLKVLPLAIGIVATVIKNQEAVIPGLKELIGLIQPIIQRGYDKAVLAQDFKLQAIYLAILQKIFLMDLVVPGVEVLSPADANAVLVSMAGPAMDDMYAKDPVPFGVCWSADRPYDPAIDSGP